MRSNQRLSSLTFLILSIIFIPLILVQTSCTKDITINLPPQEPHFVVEGHIETGLPPYVILTKSSDYYATFYLDSINNYFVHNAVVKVSDGTDTITLPELYIDTGGVTLSAYVGFGMIGKEEKTYSLWIEAEGTTLTAVTTIPKATPLDSIWYEPNVIPDNDTFIRLNCRYSDPPEPGNYVRYFTKENSQPFYPGLNSVFSDDVVNGTTFNFSLDKGVDRNDTTQFYDGYFQFRKGDTVVVKWCAIDESHFNFWRTLEFELNSQGSPFASPVVIQGNINGGLGIWGGYAPSYMSMIIPK